MGRSTFLGRNHPQICRDLCKSASMIPSRTKFKVWGVTLLTRDPTTLVLTLNWQTLERRRIIKQAMTFYKILNNIIKISPPSGLLTRSHNRHHYIVPRSRLNTVVYSFYPRAIRIWNTIPKEITEITQPESSMVSTRKGICRTGRVRDVHSRCVRLCERVFTTL